VYGCGEKHRTYNEETSLNDSIINIEYLINKNKFSEAIIEAKQLLKIDRKSTELKNLYNKAVSLINNKINLMTSGDESFNKHDYKSAAIYYKNVLKYTDEDETNFINARLEISKEKIPEQKRRKIYQNILIIVIILAILSAIGYLGYYTIVLKEDRDFSELVKSDNAKDLKSIEQMIVKYETFLRGNPNSKNKNNLIERINQYSYQIANLYYKDNWKQALRYYKKAENSIESIDSKNLKNNIYNTAFNEYKERISNAKKFNSVSKYSESLNELNNALNIINSFPDSNLPKERNILEANMLLLNKKISSIVKINDIERELREKDKELNGYGLSVNSAKTAISVRVMEFIEPDIFLMKETVGGKTIAIKGKEEDFKIGQVSNIECLESGKVTIQDDKGNDILLNLYKQIIDTDFSQENETGSSEKTAIYERVKNLKIQKEKIDSLLKISLM